MEFKRVNHRTRAEEVEVDPVGDISSDNAQAALAELDDEKAPNFRVAELERKQRLLLKWVITTFGTIPPGFEQDAARALQE